MTSHKTIEGCSKTTDDFLKDWRSGETLLLGGFGSSKTHTSSLKLILMHIGNRAPSFVAAPTFNLLWSACVPAMLHHLDELKLPYQLNGSGRGIIKTPHLLLDNQPIFLISADDPSKLTSFNAGLGWLDEGCRLPYSYDNPTRDTITQARSRIRHPDSIRRHLMISSTPEGMDHPIIKDFELDNRDPKRYRLYRAKTTDNPYLPHDYIQSLRSSYSPELARQYIDGHPIEYAANRAHPNFNDGNIKEFDWMNIDLHIGCDFNVSPATWVACYYKDGDLYVVDEIVETDHATVQTMMAKAQEKNWGAYRCVIHPDKSAANRNMTGDPQIKVIEDYANSYSWNFNIDKTLKVNPSVNQRINMLDMRIFNGLGERHLFVHPRCQRVIEELKTTSRKNNGYDPGKKGDKGHILDALGYVNYDMLDDGPAFAWQ